MLDVECFTYLNRALESTISPIVVLASNRGMATLRGTDEIVAAHGIPTDFLARLLIIPTTPYDADEIKRIVRVRSTTEGVAISDAAIDKIAEHGVRISLRYCLQLLTPARYVFFFSFNSSYFPICRPSSLPVSLFISENHSQCIPGLSYLGQFPPETFPWLYQRG